MVIVTVIDNGNDSDDYTKIVVTVMVMMKMVMIKTIIDVDWYDND